MAAVDYFLKIDGIEGESLDSKHTKEIEIMSFSWGEVQEGSHSLGAGGGAGKVRMNDFNFTMPTNKASPKLFLACANGDHIAKAVLVCRKAGKEQQEYLKWTFSDLLVSSYQIGGSGGDSSAIPTDQISLNFTKIEVEYKQQEKGGPVGGAVTAGYNLKENKKV